MSNFTITNNIYLRTIYSGNRDLANKKNRANVSNSTLSAADSAALRKGIAALADFDYTDKSSDNDTDTSKEKLYNTMRAFSDAYNNTLESASSSQNASMAKIAKQMKKLSQDYADELSTYGMSFNDSGYMSVKKASIENIATSKYEDVIGKDSEYMKKLSSYAKKLSQHIDIGV